MFYPNLLKVGASKTLSLNFSTFNGGINTKYIDNILPLKYAKNAYNFSFSNGALVDGLGLKELKLPTDTTGLTERSFSFYSNIQPLSIEHFRFYSELDNMKRHLIVCYTDTGSMFFLEIIGNVQTFTEYIMFTFDNKPTAVNYNLDGADIMLLASSDKPLTVWRTSGGSTRIDNAPRISSMCIHAERVFATTYGNRNKIWFSDDMDPTNWTVSGTEAGYITLTDERGDCNNVLSLGNYVFVMREYGISRIYAMGAQSDFNVVNVHTSSAKIYHQTAAVCNDKIVFLSDDGLYYSDSVGNVNKIEIGFESMFDKNNLAAIGEYHNGKYYLACRLNYDDDGVDFDNNDGNNSLIEINLSNGEINLLRGVNIIDLLSLRVDIVDKLVALVRVGSVNKICEVTHDGIMLEASTKKLWKSSYSDLGYPNKIKTVKEIYILSKSDLLIKISTENGSKNISIKGSTKPTRHKVLMQGVMFSIEFSADCNNVEVSSPQISVSLAGVNK